MEVVSEGWREQAVQRHLGKCLVCLGNSRRAGVAGGWVVWDAMAGAQMRGMERTYELIVPFLHLILIDLKARVSVVFSSKAGPGNWI